MEAKKTSDKQSNSEENKKCWRYPRIWTEAILENNGNIGYDKPTA